MKETPPTVKQSDTLTPPCKEDSTHLSQNSNNILEFVDIIKAFLDVFKIIRIGKDSV